MFTFVPTFCLRWCVLHVRLFDRCLRSVTLRYVLPFYVHHTLRYHVFRLDVVDLPLRAYVRSLLPDFTFYVSHRLRTAGYVYRLLYIRTRLIHTPTVVTFPAVTHY